MIYVGEKHTFVYLFLLYCRRALFQNETFSNVHHCTEGGPAGVLQEGEAIFGLLADLEIKPSTSKDLVFLLAPFRFSNFPPPLEATLFVVTKLQRAKVNGACNTLEALFSFLDTNTTKYLLETKGY